MMSDIFWSIIAVLTVVNTMMLGVMVRRHNRAWKRLRQLRYRLIEQGSYKSDPDRGW